MTLIANRHDRRHPRTGQPLTPAGYRRDGRPIWPILGGAPDTDPGLVLHSLDDLVGKTPEELRAIVDTLDERIRSLHQTPTGELRNVSDDEDAAINLMMDVRKAANAKIDRHNSIMEAMRQRPASVQSGFSLSLGAGDDPYANVRAMSVPEARDRALRVLDARSNSAHMTAAQKDQVEKQVRKMTDIARRVIVTENEDYRSAWTKLMTNPRPFLSQEEQRAVQAWEEYRAMSEGTTTAGGFGIPVNQAA